MRGKGAERVQTGTRKMEAESTHLTYQGSRLRTDLTACSGMYKLASVSPQVPRERQLQDPYIWTTSDSNQGQRRVIEALINSALHSIARRNRLEKKFVALLSSW